MALGIIFQSFFSALGQMGDARFRRVLFIGVLLTLALLIGATAGFVWLIDWVTPEQVWVPILGEVQGINDLASWGAGFLLLFLSIFLMIPVASAITSLFLEDVANAVEQRHYPHLPRGQSASFGDGLRDTVNFLGVLLVANFLALILSVLVAPAAPLIFWAVNGYLLGREYFMMVAMRRHPRTEAKSLRKKHNIAIWMAGILMTVPLSIPLLNLVIPILGAATFTHLYHHLTSDGHQTSAPHHRP
jgi:uncharacterized protein involved in cysteine biosynthesis